MNLPYLKKIVENALINLRIDLGERRTQVREQKNLEHKTYRPLALAADGGYDTQKIFSFCKKLDITPNIRVQTNSNAQANDVDRARTEVVLEQLESRRNAKGSCKFVRHKTRRKSQKMEKDSRIQPEMVCRNCDIHTQSKIRGRSYVQKYGIRQTGDKTKDLPLQPNVANRKGGIYERMMCAPGQ